MVTRKLHQHFPYNKRLNQRARELRNNPTAAEDIFWKELKKTEFYQGIVINRQKPIGNYIVDFYCHRYSFVVEIEGEIHLENDNKEYDQGRKEYLEGLGLKVVCFTNEEVINNSSEVMRKLKQVLDEQGLVC